MDNEPYSYQPLYKTSPSIRLVTILPPNDYGELCLDLEVTSLAAAANNYTAVSYTWGLGPPEHRVWIGHKPFLLRFSIWRFLKHCCKTGIHDKAKLWIDSICIDQDSVLEKNSQVQLMKEIFQNAEKVLVWLSEASESGIDKVMRQFCYEEFTQWENTHPISLIRASQKFRKFMKVYDSDLSKGALVEAVNTLAACQYWTRLWIVQEVVLARRLLFVLGACVFTKAHILSVGDWWLYDGGNKFHDDSKGLTPAETKSSLKYKRIHLIASLCTFRGQIQLGDLLRAFGEQQCQNPKDRVYGLLGLTKSSDTILVDYDITNVEPFAQSLGLLCASTGRVRWSWGHDAKLLSGALGVSRQSCLALSKLKAARDRPLDLFFPRYDIPSFVGYHIIPVLPMHDSQHSSPYPISQFLDLESETVSNEHYFQLRRSEFRRVPGREGLVAFDLSGLLCLVLRRNIDGHLSVPCLVPSTFEVGQGNMIPCRHSEGVNEGLIDNLERELAKYAQDWDQHFYCYSEPTHYQQPPSMSVSCSLWDLLQLIEIGSAMDEQVGSRGSPLGSVSHNTQVR